MRFTTLPRTTLRSVLIVGVMVSSSAAVQAEQKQKSNVQRERCAQLATRQVNTPGGVYYAAPVRGGGGGGGIAGAIIGAVVVTAIAASIASSMRAKAENNCLVAAGLRPNTEPTSASDDKPARKGTGGATAGRSTSRGAARESARSDVGTGAYGGQNWMRNSIKSQQ
jgi:hypothetical protein